MVKVGVEAVAIVVEGQVDAVEEEVADGLTAVDESVDVRLGGDEEGDVGRDVAQGYVEAT